MKNIYEINDISFSKVDYKGGKHFILQDLGKEDTMDNIIGTIPLFMVTDEFLENHISYCMYYGIPAYIGDNKSLKDRIENIRKILEKEENNL